MAISVETLALAKKATQKMIDDAQSSITGVPTKLSEFENDSDFVSRNNLDFISKQEAIETFAYKSSVSVQGSNTLTALNSVADHTAVLNVTAGESVITIGTPNGDNTYTAVTIVGKNVLSPFPQYSNPTSAITYGKEIPDPVRNKLEVGKYYCIYSPNFDSLNSDTSKLFSLRHRVNDSSSYVYDGSGRVSISFQMTAAMKSSISFQIYFTCSQLVFNDLKIQIVEVPDLTSSCAAFEEYEEKTKIINTQQVVSAQGSQTITLDLFKGINYITLNSDISPTVLSCDYYEDINSKIEELTNAIISLGGNV